MNVNKGLAIRMPNASTQTEVSFVYVQKAILEMEHFALKVYESTVYVTHSEKRGRLRLLDVLDSV